LLVLTAAAPPPDLGDFAYRQRPGNQLPLDTVFRDETGRSAALRDLLGGKPAILALVYFTVRTCAASCAPTCSMRSPTPAWWPVETIR
jgi:hypothetical protein